MRDYKKELDDTVRLLRKYMEQNRPQSFASVYGLFKTQRWRCDIFGIERESYNDIKEYAEKENIERFGFV